MAMTQPALLALGGFATLATIGMFLEYGDQATRPLVGFVASVAWGVVSLSAFNVFIPTDSVGYEVSITPVAWFAAGLAITTFFFSFWTLLQLLKDEAEDAELTIT